jgi:hypothetical protein
MPLPTPGSQVTVEQVNHALNIKQFPGATPGDKAWHEGQFEPWMLQFGYPEGKALYANVNCPGAGAAGYHIYWLNDGNDAAIILKTGETPAKYNVQPKKKT